MAITSNINPFEILNRALIKAMENIGEAIKKREIFIPEMMIAAKAMNAGLEILKPELAGRSNDNIGKVVIGTVQGDLHDIGKNLVTIMMRGLGIEVIDLGVNVSPEMFVNKAEEAQARIVCMSALLTTTMTGMKEVIEEFKRRDIRQKYIFMVGGSPVTPAFAEEINADFYTPDAVSAAELAKKLLIEMQS
ncbi:corrinoid methyltransferase [Paenibacillus albidus]|uniref:Corrinoid methyltransferase n=1 Tax=Paenibacillus albidus TaxID=2041023 RepID=A0A917D3J3_9BACL|nr:corrinoid methyltransferase [Paenibacillus albidus]